jgi:hypothetical protein
MPSGIMSVPPAQCSSHNQTSNLCRVCTCVRLTPCQKLEPNIKHAVRRITATPRQHHRFLLFGLPVLLRLSPLFGAPPKGDAPRGVDAGKGEPKLPMPGVPWGVAPAGVWPPNIPPAASTTAFRRYGPALAHMPQPCSDLEQLGCMQGAAAANRASCSNASFFHTSHRMCFPSTPMALPVCMRQTQAEVAIKLQSTLTSCRGWQCKQTSRLRPSREIRLLLPCCCSS